MRVLLGDNMGHGLVLPDRDQFWSTYRFTSITNTLSGVRLWVPETVARTVTANSVLKRLHELLEEDGEPDPPERESIGSDLPASDQHPTGMYL